jgi:hypothetical protein
VEHLATGRQHSDARAKGQHHGRDARRVRERALASVEDQNRLGFAQARDDAGQRIGPASIDRIGEDPLDADSAACARDLNQPCPVTQIALE